MAVIRDLPAELLHRILELAAAAATNLTYRDSQTRSSLLGVTSLVASPWRAASQRLLFADVTLCSKQGSKRLLAHLKGRTSPPTIERLLVEDASHIRQVVAQSKGLRELAIQTGIRGDSGVIDLDAALVSGLRSLSLSTTTPFSIPPLLSPIQLTRLSISSAQPFFPMALESLLRASTSLKELHLDWGRGQDFPSPRIKSLETIAPQLHTLQLTCAPASERWPRTGHTLSTFLLQCTNLKSLHLADCHLEEMKHLIQPLPSKLQTLETRPSINETYLLASILDSSSLDLIAATKLPPLSELKRWRCDWSDWLPYKVDVLSWEALLRERGIELRDQTRFFTDYPSTSS